MKKFDNYYNNLNKTQYFLHAYSEYSKNINIIICIILFTFLSIQLFYVEKELLEKTLVFYLLLITIIESIYLIINLSVYSLLLIKLTFIKKSKKEEINPLFMFILLFIDQFL